MGGVVACGDAVKWLQGFSAIVHVGYGVMKTAHGPADNLCAQPRPLTNLTTSCTSLSAVDHLVVHHYTG